MRRKEIETYILEQLNSYSDGDEFTLEDSLRKGNLLDSLDRIELAIRIENKFNITIPDDVAESWYEQESPISHIVDWVESHI